MAYTRESIQQAQRHLGKNDPVMRQIMNDVGPFTLRVDRNRFGMLVRSVISQQISTAAARTIRSRLEGMLAPEKITAQGILSLDLEELRRAGLSARKASYLIDLARTIDMGIIDLRKIGRKTDEQVIEELVQVKGIGRWTAQMFLIFSLGRLDIFPHDDLGVRVAIRNRYDFAELPDKQQMFEVASRWRPYASIASWYCWRSTDLDRNDKK